MNERAASLAGFPPQSITPIENGLPWPTPVLNLPDDQPVETLVEGLIYRGDQNLIVGRSGAWKSTFTLQILCSISTGTPLLGDIETQAGPCLYLSEEDPRGRIRMRTRAIAHGHHLDYEKLLDLHVLAREGAKLEDRGWQRHILSVARELGCVCVAFDPLRKLTRLDLNSDRDVNEINAFFSELAELPMRPGIITNHHAKKSGSEGPKLDQLARGSAAIVDASRSVLHIEKVPDGFRVEHLKFQDATEQTRFTVEASITSGDEAWHWETARFSRTDTRRADQRAAAPHVLEMLREKPGSCSTEIREALKGTAGLTPRGVSDAITSLHEAGRIRLEKVGKRKNWYAVAS